MDRLYTESEWRAIAELEERVDHWFKSDFAKRIIGWTFGNGEFYIAGYFPHSSDKFVGPRQPLWFVFEATSSSRITWDVDTKAEALAGARERLTDAPPDHVQRIFDKRREEIAEQEAKLAINLARRAPKPRKIGKRLRQIFAAANGKCHYCATDLELTGDWEVDHKMPKALGGSNDSVNLVAACKPCNRAKKDKTDVEFFALLAARTS